MSTWRQRSQNAETGKPLAQIIHGTAWEKSSFSVRCGPIRLWSNLKAEGGLVEQSEERFISPFAGDTKETAALTREAACWVTFEGMCVGRRGMETDQDTTGQPLVSVTYSYSLCPTSVLLLTPQKSTENIWMFHGRRWGSVRLNQSGSLCVCASTSLTPLHFQGSWRGCGGSSVCGWIYSRSEGSPAALNHLNVVKEQQFPLANLNLPALVHLLTNRTLQ